MKIALVYDRVNKWGGAERVLLSLHELFPDAPLYTSVYAPHKAKWAKIFPNVIPSFLQRYPYLREKHELLGSFTPIAFELTDFSDYDVVVSVTSEAAKGIITTPRTKHICYLLTPTRYLWSGYKLYFKNPLLKKVSKPVVKYLKRWDRVAANRPDMLVAISTCVKGRIKRYYKKDSIVVFPPVNLPKDKKIPRKGNYFLIVSRLVAYKKVDLAIKAFNKLGLPLYVIGSGSESGKLKRMAKGNIKFLGEVTDKRLSDYYYRAQAVIFPQEEDFGIVAVEAQAHGTPVIAFRGGGAIDTVVGGVTGIFFSRQEVDSLVQAVAQFKKSKFNKVNLRRNAARFSSENFKKQIKQIVYGAFRQT